jgi:hypothetical protein
VVAATTTVTMTVAVVAVVVATEVEAVVAVTTMTAATTAVTEVMVDETETNMLLEESTDTPATIAMVVEEMTAHAEVADTLTAMIVGETVVLLAMLLQQPPMVIQPLEERPGNHTEVDTTMRRDM